MVEKIINLFYGGKECSKAEFEINFGKKQKILKRPMKLPRTKEYIRVIYSLLEPRNQGRNWN